MDRFLVNMAIIRVNWDQKGNSILDNYIPLIEEALRQIDGDVFSLEQFKSKFVEISDFEIPTGAVLSLLKRAENKYKLIYKDKNIYYINRSEIKNISMSTLRNTEQRRYNELALKFKKWCIDNYHIEIDKDDFSQFFFNILYDISPSLFANISDAENIKFGDDSKQKYLVAKFVAWADKFDQNSFDAILSFVRGAMLTETFYYSQNYNDIENKPLKKVKVFFDTSFLLRALGYASETFVSPCVELINMLNELNVGMFYFKHTLDEMHGIFTAALHQAHEGNRILQSRKPGDLFDFINLNGWTRSDILLAKESLESKLNALNVNVEQMKEIETVYSIDERSLRDKLKEKFTEQSESARNHDIDCIHAVFQMRQGRVQPYLDRCKAIFITTNNSLAILTTKYFNDLIGHSNSPVCMSDHVFSSLVWMKTVKKSEKIPVDRLVATCYAALLPSEEQWNKYVQEANKLKSDGRISENDYYVLISSQIARDCFMDKSFTTEDNIFGTLPEILHKAKIEYTEEIGDQLLTYKKKAMEFSCRIENFVNKAESVINRCIFITILILFISVLLSGLFVSKPASLEEIKEISFQNVIFIITSLLSIASVLTGFILIRFCDKVSNILSRSFAKYLLSQLTDSNPL